MSALDDKVHVLLTDNHRRSITVTLQLLDQQLCQWEGWMEENFGRGVMYQQQDNVSSRDKSELRRRIAELRTLIVRTRDELKLKPSKPGTAQLIVSQSTSLWEMLAELNSSSLRGYGKVSPELAGYIDPLGEVLAERLNEISGLFSQPNPSAPKSGKRK